MDGVGRVVLSRVYSYAGSKSGATIPTGFAAELMAAHFMYSRPRPLVAEAP